MNSYDKFESIINDNDQTLLGSLLEKFKGLIDFASPFFLATYTKSCGKFAYLVNRQKNVKLTVEITTKKHLVDEKNSIFFEYLGQVATFGVDLDL